MRQKLSTIYNRIFEEKILTPEEVELKKAGKTQAKKMLKILGNFTIGCLLLYFAFNGVRNSWIADRAAYFHTTPISEELRAYGIGDGTIELLKLIKISHNRYDIVYKIKSNKNHRETNIIVEIWVLSMFRSQDHYEYRISPAEKLRAASILNDN